MAAQSWRFLWPSSLAALAAWTLALIWSHLAGLAARQRWRAAGRTPGRPPSVSLAAGHRLTCVVTGASSGLGWALSRALFAAGHHVVLACPDPARGAAALQALRAVPEPSEPLVGGGSSDFEPLDLRDPDSVREFCSRLPGLIPRGSASSLELRGQPPPGRPPLGLLVLNAACMPACEAWCPAAGASADFAANCLGHALLVELLLARARPEQSVRRDALVLNVTSFTHRCVRRSETGQLRRALRGGRLAGSRRLRPTTSQSGPPWCCRGSCTAAVPPLACRTTNCCTWTPELWTPPSSATGQPPYAGPSLRSCAPSASPPRPCAPRRGCSKPHPPTSAGRAGRGRPRRAAGTSSPRRAAAPPCAPPPSRAARASASASGRPAARSAPGGQGTQPGRGPPSRWRRRRIAAQCSRKPSAVESGREKK